MERSLLDADQHAAGLTNDTRELPRPQTLRCAAVLTHHWLVRVRGGEKVLRALCELLPDSPIYTLVHDPRGVGPGWPPVRTSFLQRLPRAARYYPKLLPLVPLAARRVKLPPVDLVVCSDAAIAKAMRAHPRSKVVCYCHSPMRYVWEERIHKDYCATLSSPSRWLFARLVARLRRADYQAARRVDQFVANSKHVADRIRRCYGRDAVVVYPPAELPPDPTTTPRQDFYLCVGHHVPYKRLDLAISACRKLRRRLVVIGDGPDTNRLRAVAGTAVQWLGWQTTEVIADCYRRAAALLFPGEEDFGLVPVEAMAHGCPVIAYGVGGATETVVDGETGVLFGEQTAAALVAAMERAATIAFDPVQMHSRTQRFGRERFLREMRAVLVQVLSS